MTEQTMRDFINITESKDMGNEFYKDVKIEKDEKGKVNKKSVMKPYTKLKDTPKMSIKESEELNSYKDALIKNQNEVMESAKQELAGVESQELKSFWNNSIKSINETIDGIMKSQSVSELKETYSKLPESEQLLETKVYGYAKQLESGNWELSYSSNTKQFNESNTLQGYVAKLSNDEKTVINLIMTESSGEESKEVFTPLEK